MSERSDPEPLERPVLPAPGVHSATSLELHSGLVFGSEESPVLDRLMSGRSAPHPRVVLEDLIGQAMREGPCVVRFSGGRDSSLVLAVAAHVARRDGDELPTAVIVRYPSNPDADESPWQRLVLDHLDVPYEVVEVADGDDDIAGPLGVAQLLRVGPLIPPTSGVSLGRIGPAVAGRTVLSGQGGDEVLGGSRISAYVAHWRRRRKPTREAATAMARDLLPRPVRRVVAAQELRSDHPSFWLRGDARREVTRELVQVMSDAPWDWRTDRLDAARARLWAVGAANLSRVAAVEGFTLVDPLLDPRFVHAMCVRGGRLGLATRTEAMRLLAEDLLPLKLLRRDTKAYFDNVYGGRHTRDFARTWNGGGVDTDLVDVEQLRSAWSSEHIPVASLAPLQLALLDATEHGWEPRDSLGSVP